MFPCQPDGQPDREMGDYGHDRASPRDGASRPEDGVHRPGGGRGSSIACSRTSSTGPAGSPANGCRSAAASRTTGTCATTRSCSSSRRRPSRSEKRARKSRAGCAFVHLANQPDWAEAFLLSLGGASTSSAPYSANGTLWCGRGADQEPPRHDSRSLREKHFAQYFAATRTRARADSTRRGSRLASRHARAPAPGRARPPRRRAHADGAGGGLSTDPERTGLRRRRRSAPARVPLPLQRHVPRLARAAAAHAASDPRLVPRPAGQRRRRSVRLPLRDRRQRRRRRSRPRRLPQACRTPSTPSREASSARRARS